VAVPATQADADWLAITNDEKRDEINDAEGKLATSAERSLLEWQWTETHYLAYERDGLAFWDRYPNDPRRYQWLVWATRNMHDLHYFKDPAQGAQGLLAFYKDHTPLNEEIDEAAKGAWYARYPELKQALLDSPQATEQQKCQITGYDISARLQAAAWAARSGGKPDVSGIENDIVRYAAKYPNARKTFPQIASYFGGYYPAVLARGLILFKPLPNQFLLDRAEAPGFLKRLSKSPDAELVTFSAAEAQIDALRVSPLDLRFTAMDGQEVNLSKLRGKVVIVEFSAVTWCSACQQMRPVMKSLYTKYHDQGLEVVTILLDNTKDKDKVAGILKAEGDLWPEWLTGSNTGNAFTQRFGVNGVPYTLFLGKDGLLAYDVAGWGPNMDGLTDSIVKQLLQPAQ
jgi:thiol-disulfide isomerase/thioredoxin